MSVGGEGRSVVARGVRALQWAVIALSIFTVVHRNIVRPRLGDPWRTGDGLLAELYGDLYELGRRLGMAPAWRMYSPVPRVIHRFDFAVREPDGTLRPVETEDLSPEHRARQSFLDRWLFDTKLARVLDNHMVYEDQYDPRLLPLYLEHVRRELEAREGHRVEELLLEVREARIPPPEEHGDWTPQTASFDRVVLTRTLRR